MPNGRARCSQDASRRSGGFFLTAGFLTSFFVFFSTMTRRLTSFWCCAYPSLVALADFPMILTLVRLR